MSQEKMHSAFAILKHESGNKEKACRMLFGPMDHEQLRADFNELMQKSNEEAKAKWNFDFATETPLEGQYDWVKVENNTLNPQVFQNCESSDSEKQKQKLITEKMQSALAIPKQASGNKEKACRMIFGPIDHEQLRAEFDEFMQKSNEEAKAKWNFDFATETPLKGQYDWVKVENHTLNDSSQKENQCQDVATERCNIIPSSKAFQNYERSDSGKRKQKLITDFYPVKRRCSPVPSLRD